MTVPVSPARRSTADLLAVRARVARLQEADLVVATGEASREAAAVARHQDELFGAPVVGETASRGRVLVEWIGEPSPLDSPLVVTLRLRGVLLPHERAVLARAAIRRKARVDGLTSRTLTAERDRMTETIRWGPATGSYVRALTFADARRLFDDPALAHEFRLVETAETGPAMRPDDAWLDLINGLRAQRGLPPVAADYAAMQTVYGPEMKLVKVDGAGRTGQWAPHLSR